jgi:acyl-coenzyme A thioesterase PaaI-like protein
MKASRLRLLMNLWPPFLFSGIRVTRMDEDFGFVRVELRQHWFNRNYVGTHFGGSLFAMTDPFWMIMLIRRVGPEYLVWDQAADIRYVKPGRGTVAVEFELSPETVAGITAEAADGRKVLRWLPMQVRDANGDVVAEVRKQVYVRRKRSAPATSG